MKYSIEERMGIDDFSVKPSRYGIRNDEDGGWEIWALFNIADVRDDEGAGDSDADLISGTPLAESLTDWEGHDARYAGTHYADYPHARVSRNRVLVTQSGGLDI